MSWITPTGHNATGWSDEGKVYDEATGGTPASQLIDGGGEWSSRLELTHAAIEDCGSVRFWVGRENVDITDVKVELYYDSGWHTIYNGSILTLGSWWQFSIGSTQTVTQMGISFYNDSEGSDYEAYVYEVDFGQIPAGRPLVGGGLAR